MEAVPQPLVAVGCIGAVLAIGVWLIYGPKDLQASSDSSASGSQEPPQNGTTSPPAAPPQALIDGSEIKRTGELNQVTIAPIPPLTTTVLPPTTDTVMAVVHRAPTSSVTATVPKKSLKQRTDEFGKDLFEWVERKDEKNPGPSIIAGDQVQNAYQMGAQSVYMREARAEYERVFAPRGVALQEELKQCGIDISKHPYFTNPGIIVDTMIARHLSLAFRATAASMPDDDKDLKCGQQK